MKTYTKDQVIEIVSDVLGRGGYSTHIKDIKDRFNNLEKTQFEPWRWYVNGGVHFMLFDPNKKNFMPGFNGSGVWSCGIFNLSDYWQPATQEQIEPLIRAEAERRGFVEGAKFNSVDEFEGCDNYTRKNNEVISSEEIQYDFEEDALTTSYGVLYEKGRWATLVEEKSLEDRITELEKKVEQLNEKLCQD